MSLPVRLLVSLLVPLSGMIVCGAARAASSWTLQTIPEGEGVWVASSGTRFVLCGTFEDGPLRRSMDGGFSWERSGDQPEVAADSVAGLTMWGERCLLLSLSGAIWQSSYMGWRWVQIGSPADSFGTATTIEDAGSDVWAGTGTGWLLRQDRNPSTWEPIAQLDTAGVRQIARGMPGRAVVLLENGRLFAQDSIWIEAPLLASRLSFPNEGAASGFGHALDRETLQLWKTTDGGVEWSVISTALASAELEPWARKARGLLVQRNGLGLIPCGDVLLASEDGGVSWRIAASGSGMFLDVAVDELNELVTAGKRIHRSTDWAFSLKQTIGGDFGAVEMGSTWILWALDGGLLLSIDIGESWWRQPLPDDAAELTRIAARGDYEIWLHFDGPQGARTYYSNDRGTDYETLDPSGWLDGMRGWSLSSTEVVWAFTDSMLLRSLDDGRSWEPVREDLPRIDAMATRGSLRVALASGEQLFVTSDGALTWDEHLLPAGSRFHAVALAGDSLLIGAGARLVVMQAGPPWENVAEYDFGDTLFDVLMTEDEAGWAVGNSGLLVETTDGGRTWARYAIDLEINAIRSRLPSLSASDASHAVAGTGTTLLRLLPDIWGPRFRYGISVNPHLGRYLDIHVTPRERLAGDALHVEIDGVEIPAVLLDPEGFLYRVRYHVPARPGELKMVTQGSDWVGNVRTEVLDLRTTTLGGDGTGWVSWDGAMLRLQGASGVIVAMLEAPIEEPPPQGYVPVSRPFRVAAGGRATISAGSEREALAAWENGRWQLLGSPPAPITENAVLVLVRDENDPPLAWRERETLRVYPIPTRDEVTIEWKETTGGALVWEIFGVTGRRLASGVSTGQTPEPLRLRILDGAGRRLPAGVYWLRVRKGATQAVRKLLISR